MVGPRCAYRIQLIVLVLAFAVVAGSCASTPAREPIDADDVRSESARLTQTAQGHLDAWNAQHPDAIRSFWGAETVHEDPGFGVELSGEELAGLPDRFFATYPGFWSVLDDVFISRGVVLDITRVWGLDLRSVAFTEAEPLVEVDRIEIEPDGTLGRWTLFYGLDAYRKWSALDSEIEAAESVIQAYAATWASGDATQVQELYSADARRVDLLFETDFNGADAIGDYAADLASWYPDATYVPELIFSDSRLRITDPERIGAVYTVRGAGVDGASCDVAMAVILTVSQGSIIEEEVFWDADSLVRCGWAA